VQLELEAQEESGNPELGYGEYIQRVVKSNNGAAIMNLFKELLQSSCGFREGNEFIQSEEYSERFINSAAFDALLTIFLTNPDEASVFVNGIMPRELMELAERPIKDVQIPENAVAAKVGSGPAIADLDPVTFEDMMKASGLTNPLSENGDSFVPWWNREPTGKELSTMPNAYRVDVFKRKSAGWKAPV
jgi:hypothetical protein